MKRIFCFIICSFFLCGHLLGQQPVTSQYSYRHFTTDDGLPKMYTECLFQDSKNFIWIGTLHGLVRYNGFQFETFDNVKNAGITMLRESKKGNVMAFEFDAYYIFDYQTEKFIKKNYPPKLHFNELGSRSLPAGYAIFNKIDGDKENKILCRIANEMIEPVLQNSALDSMVNANGSFLDLDKNRLYLPCDIDKTIKIITLDGKIIFSQKMVRPYTIFKHHETIYCIAESGLYRFTGDKFELFIAHHFPVSYSFIKTAKDIEDNLIISDLKEVYRLKNNQLERIFNNANLIIDICIDKEGNLWLATYQGVYNLFRQQFKNYLLSDQKDMFRVIAENPNGKDIITGTFDGKLLSITPSLSKQHVYPSNPNGYFFENYCAKTPTAIYLPAAGNVMKYENNKAKWLKLPDQEYRCVATMPDGNIIAGWEGSYFIFSPDGKIIKQLQSKELLQFCRTRPCFDKEGNLYMGGNKGVTRISRDKSILISNPDTREIWTLKNDNYGNIWAGTNRMLLNIKDGKLVKFKELIGDITTIFFTKSNMMLVGTTKGIYIFDNLLQHYAIYNYSNGYTLVEPARCDMVEDAQGNIWMPSVGGLACFNPNLLLYKQPVPLLHVLSLSSSIDNIDWQKTDKLKYVFNYKQKNIRFSYIGISYSQGQNVRYQYRLVGFQNEWSNPIAEREVTFNNLQPGKYTFELKCNAGIPETQTEIVSVPIYIKPAFWQTWWFVTLFIASSIGLIMWAVSTYNKKKHAAELNKANREKEMNELRVQSVRLKSIPHFNSNVLAGIEYLIMTKSKEEANQLLSTYSRFTNITLHEIDKAQRPLKNELDYVRMYLELEKMRYGDKLSYNMDIDPKIDQDIMIPNMVLHTYAENAIKHGIRGKNQTGTIIIKAIDGKEGVRLSVEDDGIGREAAAKSGIVSTKQGLSILTRQIELYNQQNTQKIVQTIYDLKDANDKPTGTRFELYVPYNYKYI